MTGRKQAFNFEPTNQVLTVKQALQEKEGILVDQIRLIFSGKQLYVDNRRKWNKKICSFLSRFICRLYRFTHTLSLFTIMDILERMIKPWNHIILQLVQLFIWYFNFVVVQRIKTNTWRSNPCILLLLHGFGDISSNNYIKFILDKYIYIRATGRTC